MNVLPKDTPNARVAVLSSWNYTSKLLCNCKSRTLIPFNPSDSNYIVDLNLGFDGCVVVLLRLPFASSPSILNEKKKQKSNKVPPVWSWSSFVYGIFCFLNYRAAKSILVGILCSANYWVADGCWSDQCGIPLRGWRGSRKLPLIERIFAFCSVCFT